MIVGDSTASPSMLAVRDAIWLRIAIRGARGIQSVSFGVDGGVWELMRPLEHLEPL
jgi:hypothetical protein